MMGFYARVYQVSENEKRLFETDLNVFLSLSSEALNGFRSPKGLKKIFNTERSMSSVNL